MQIPHILFIIGILFISIVSMVRHYKKTPGKPSFTQIIFFIIAVVVCINIINLFLIGR